MKKILFTTKSEKISIASGEELVIFDIILDNENAERHIEVMLEGEGAKVELYGLFFGSGETVFKSSHIVRHIAAYTKSELLTKGVLNDKAKMDYTSLIDIKKGTAGCSGDQKEDTLLLSRDAKVDAVPALEIANDDVSASHSVATTYIDEIKKFYLQSRGLPEEEVVKTIVKGHFGEVLNKIEDEKVKQDFEEKIAIKL